MRSALPFRSTRRGKSASAPVLATPTFTGTPTARQTLTAGTVAYTNTPTVPVTVTYRWQSSADGLTGWGNAAVQGSETGTNSTYVIADAEYARYVRVQVTATNSVGSDTKQSAASTQVAGVAPVLSSASISGTVKEGTTVTAVPTYSTTGVPTPTATYQWQHSVDGSTGWTDISFATASTYLLDTSYAAEFLRVQISASNTYGSTGPVSSSATRIDTLYFGDGSDGDVTISTTVTLAGAKKYRNLTISSGGVLIPAGFLVQVAQTLTGVDATSVIQANGDAGTAGTNQATTGVRGTGGAGATGRAGGGSGGAGGQGTSISAVSADGDPGGNGGHFTNGGGQAAAGLNGSSANYPPGTKVGGGAGIEQGTPSAPTSKSDIRDNLGSWQGGGGGGGGGGGDSSNGKGGYISYGGDGGGAGGGVIRVLAQIWAGTGSLQAKGGASGTPASAAGGGGGGYIMAGTYSSSLASWTTSVTAGSTSAFVGRTYSRTGAGN